MIVVDMLQWDRTPACDLCGARMTALYFAVTLPPHRGVPSRLRCNVAQPCGCVSNVQDVTDGEPPPPSPERLHRHRPRVAGGRRRD